MALLDPFVGLVPASARRVDASQRRGARPFVVPLNCTMLPAVIPACMSPPNGLHLRDGRGISNGQHHASRYTQPKVSRHRCPDAAPTSQRGRQGLTRDISLPCGRMPRCSLYKGVAKRCPSPTSASRHTMCAARVETRVERHQWCIPTSYLKCLSRRRGGRPSPPPRGCGRVARGRFGRTLEAFPW